VGIVAHCETRAEMRNKVGGTTLPVTHNAAGAFFKATYIMQTNYLSGARALSVARKRFSNLCANGIQGIHATGDPIDHDDVTRAMYLLRQCRQTKVPTMHSFDVCHLIDIQAGAVIAACVALDFDVRSWFGAVAYPPHALIAVNQKDVRRVAADG
jgi:hypothetical protein